MFQNSGIKFTKHPEIDYEQLLTNNANKISNHRIKVKIPESMIKLEKWICNTIDYQNVYRIP